MSEKENLTKKYIYTAFLQLLEKKHYNDISVCEICTKAGVSRMSFYRNFDSKEDLTFKGLKDILADLEINFKNLEVLNKYTIIQEFFNVAKKYKNAIISLQNSNIVKTLKDIVIQELSENSCNIDYFNKTSKYVPIIYFSAVTSVLFAWLKQGAIESPEDMARMISSALNVDFLEHHKSLSQIDGIAEDDIKNFTKKS